MPGTIISIESARKTYGAVTALGGVDLHITEGEFLTLLGPSGSGKTTLLMALAGFTDLDAGRVLLNGQDITAALPEKRGFGMVFQGYALFPNMTVNGNIAFPLKVRGWDRARIEARVAECLDMVQMRDYAARMPSQLSGGQQQRVALARALSFSPSVLLLDEPLSALDKKLRANLQWELKDLHDKLGVTFVYVTHDQEEALSMSDRIVILKDGAISAGGHTEGPLQPAVQFLRCRLSRQVELFRRDDHGNDRRRRGVRRRQPGLHRRGAPGASRSAAPNALPCVRNACASRRPARKSFPAGSARRRFSAARRN